MSVDFKNMPSHSRVWIYQSGSTFTDDEARNIKSKLMEFINHWESHGAKLIAAGEIYYNRFIVIAVDEKKQPASGCSIDKSVDFTRQIEKEFNLNLFNRELVAYRENGEIKTEDMSSIKDKIKNSLFPSNTIIFNNLVSNVGELNSCWEITAGESWLGKFYKSSFRNKTIQIVN